MRRRQRRLTTSAGLVLALLLSGVLVLAAIVAVDFVRAVTR